MLKIKGGKGSWPGATENDKVGQWEDPGKKAGGREVPRQAWLWKGQEGNGIDCWMQAESSGPEGPQLSSSSLMVMRSGQMRSGSGDPSPREPPR